MRLGEQSLTLYKDGAVVLRTPVTTGRPALPTPVGSYDIAWRRSPYTFISPWPQGNPYYYPPAHVRWAMYFFDNDFLHDSYEPAGAYGKGSNLGPYASHGCVHVPGDVMQVLYTTVPDHTPLDRRRRLTRRMPARRALAGYEAVGRRWPLRTG